MLPAWQGLRQRALATIPQHTRTEFTKPYGLSQWRELGSYTVFAITSKRITLAVSSEEIGSVLLTDAEYHLDHAAEHQASLWQELQSGRWRSPAWFVVTSYYWAYFLAMAATRLCGRTVWYLDGGASRNFKNLSVNGSANPGAGTYRLECAGSLNAIERQVDLTRSTGRLHDGLWRSWHALMTSFRSLDMPDRLDVRLLNSFARASATLGEEWPSEVRNIINYRPGAAYDAVRGATVLGNLSVLPSMIGLKVSDAIDGLESSVSLLEKGRPIAAQLRPVATCLVHFAVGLYALTEALHSDLVERARLDPRWQRARAQFRRTRGLTDGRFCWPCDVEGLAT